MSDPFDALIGEIAAKHGIAVSRDDPILIMQTINNRLMQDSAQAQQVQLKHFKDEMEALSLQWQCDTRDRAEQILNASRCAGKAGMAQCMQDGASAIIDALRLEVDVAVSRMATSTREAHRIAAFNVVASCLTMGAAAVALWTVLR